MNNVSDRKVYIVGTYIKRNANMDTKKIDKNVLFILDKVIDEKKFIVIPIVYNYYMNNYTVSELGEMGYSFGMINDYVKVYNLNKKIISTILNNTDIMSRTKGDNNVTKFFINVIDKLGNGFGRKDLSIRRRKKLIKMLKEILINREISLLTLIHICGFVFINKSYPFSFSGTYNKLMENGKLFILDNKELEYIMNSLKSIDLFEFRRGLRVATLKEYRKRDKFIHVPYFHILYPATMKGYFLPLILNLINDSCSKILLHEFCKGIKLRMVLGKKVFINKVLNGGKDYLNERIKSIEKDIVNDDIRKIFKEVNKKRVINKILNELQNNGILLF